MSSGNENRFTALLSGLRQHGPLLAILLLALGVRLYNISFNALYADELHSIHTALGGQALNIDIHPPLYFLLLQWWSFLGPDSDEYFRALSAIFGVWSVYAMFLLVRAWLDRRAALLASLFLAVSTFNVFFSQEIRGYSLLEMLSLFTAAAFVVYIRGGKNRVLIGYVIAAAGAVYVHHLGSLTAVAANVVFLASYRRYRLRPRIRAWIVAQLALLVLSAPTLYKLVLQKLWTEQVGWIPVMSTQCAVESVRDLGGSVSVVSCALWIVALAGVTVGLVVKRSRPAAVDIAVWGFIQLVLVMGLSMWVTPMACGSRHLIQASFLLCWGGVLLIWTLRSRAARVLLTTLVLVLELIALQAYFETPSKTEWHRASAMVAEKIAANEVAVVTDWDWMGALFGRYYPKASQLLTVHVEGSLHGPKETELARSGRWLRQRLVAGRVKGAFYITIDAPLYQTVNQAMTDTLERMCRRETVTRLGSGGTLADCLAYYFPILVTHYSGCGDPAFVKPP